MKKDTGKKNLDYYKKVRKVQPPAEKVMKDRKKEANKKACRNWKNEE